VPGRRLPADLNYPQILRILDPLTLTDGSPLSIVSNCIRAQSDRDPSEFSV
jgi:hypothetical protein